MKQIIYSLSAKIKDLLVTASNELEEAELLADKLHKMRRLEYEVTSNDLDQDIIDSYVHRICNHRCRHSKAHIKAEHLRAALNIIRTEAGDSFDNQHPEIL